MANPEHFKILKEGISAWSEWRESNPEIEPDLSGADFHRDDLRAADLSRANLRGADLGLANLYTSNLSEANLSTTDLCGANIYGANLKGSNLNRACLSRANLSEANLSGANLFAAELSGAGVNNADFTGVQLGGTILADMDLSQVKGLDKAEHLAPSSIGIDTFFKSQGKIPEAFLRGCGVPDIFIQYAASLAGKPYDYYSCFISYSHKDEEFAQRLHADLQAKGVRCWFAPDDLKTGDKFRVKIDETIRVYDKLLVALSENSVKSDWVEKEVETAFDKERQQKRLMLFPIRLDDTVMNVDAGWAADIRRSRHVGDFRNWRDHDAYKDAFNRLLRDLKSSENKTKTE